MGPEYGHLLGKGKGDGREGMWSREPEQQRKDVMRYILIRKGYIGRWKGTGRLEGNQEEEGLI